MNRKNKPSKGYVKTGNPDYVEAMQELRRSGAAGPHTPKTAYKRRPKHRNKGWADD